MGGVRSIAICFCSTVSLPLNQPHSDASRATTRSVAGPSLMPGSLASATLTFFSATGAANCSAAMVVSGPPADSVIDSDFRPAPASATRDLQRRGADHVGIRREPDLRRLRLEARPEVDPAGDQAGHQNDEEDEN